MQSSIKILTVNLPEKFSDKLLNNFSENHHTISMIENLYSETSQKMIDKSQLVIVQTDSDKYSLENLSQFCQSNPFVEVIGVHTATETAKHQFIKAGLFDIIDENCSEDDLKLVLLRASKVQKSKSEVSVLKQYVAMNYGFDNLIGESKPMSQLKEKIKKVSPTDIAVMLTGPTGSGKSLTANIIHHHSERRKFPFVTLDCASTPEPMFDEILFGSDSNSKSLLAKADNGTLFIKDIHLLPYTIQEKLTTFLHTNKLDNNANSKKLSVRFISSTNQQLQNAVGSGTFERELSHMLSEVLIAVPSLKDRLDDVELLANYFARKLSNESGSALYNFSRSALELLYNHHWSDNIRELENTIKRATTLCHTNQIEESDILFVESGNMNSSANRFTVDMTSDQSKGILDEGQRSLIIKTLNDNDWNFTQTAVELGIGRTTLWRKVKKYNLKKESAELV